MTDVPVLQAGKELPKDVALKDAFADFSEIVRGSAGPGLRFKHAGQGLRYRSAGNGSGGLETRPDFASSISTWFLSRIVPVAQSSCTRAKA